MGVVVRRLPGGRFASILLETPNTQTRDKVRLRRVGFTFTFETIRIQSRRETTDGN